MKIKLLLLILVVTFQGLFAQQILTWTPMFATVEDTITIVYDATQGNAGLVGATEVYAHTGVITDQSVSPSDWKHVKTNWGVNTPETRLTSLGNNKWQIRFHIRSYYGVGPSEVVRQLAFVFRNASATREGKTAGGGDIFLPIYQPGLQVSLLSPAPLPYFAALNDTFFIRAQASDAVSLTLYSGTQIVATSPGDSVRYRVIASEYGRKDFKVIAKDQDGQVKEIVFYYVVNPPLTTAPLPAGLINGINYVSDNSVYLVLFGRNKSFSYVIGDFNDWEVKPEFYMKRTPNGDQFWLKIDNLQVGKEYGFQYLVDGTLRIADPFADKVLDPWHDQFIATSTYPHLMPYPQGKTTEIVSVLQTGQEPYPWHVAQFNRPAKEDLVIYELLVRDFIAEHDFTTLIDSLDYFQRLGINAIELMPVNEFEGNESWGYNPSFYFAPDKYYGPKNDLKRFIDECHKRGIAVIMDMVLNHAYGQSPLVRMYVDNLSKSPWFNAVSPNPVYFWGYDFNHESTATKDLVDRVLAYWVQEFKIDGFRLDFTKGFTNTPGDGWARDNARIAILKRIADKLWAKDPTVYLILEHLTDNSEERELANYGMMLWGKMTDQYNEGTMGYSESGKADFSWGYYKTRNWEKSGLVSYMESHDEERLMYKNLQFGRVSGSYNVRDLNTALERMKLAATFFFTIPGPKMIWQFGELGYDYSINYDGRLGKKPIRWDYYQEPKRRELYNSFAALIHLKKTFPVFREGQVDLALFNPAKRIKLSHPDMNVVIIGNFDVKNQSIAPSFHHTGTWYNYFSGDSITVQDASQSFPMAAGTFYIYTDKKIARPDIVSFIEPSRGKHPSDYILYPNYPNPFNATTRIEYDVAQTTDMALEIFDVCGTTVRTLFKGVQSPGKHHAEWNGETDTGVAASSGIYFLRLRTGGYQIIQKMIMLQ